MKTEGMDMENLQNLITLEEPTLETWNMDSRIWTRIIQKSDMVYSMDFTRSVCDVIAGFFNTAMKASIP